jgi:hypothetical protein
MNELKIMDRVKQLPGGTFLHNARSYKVLQVYQETDKVVIATDKKMFNVPMHELGDFLANFLEADPEEEAIQTVKKEVMSVTDKTVLKNLSEILFENIEKIKKDPSYIDQADAINSQAKSIIDIAKIEVDLLKTLKGT